MYDVGMEKIAVGKQMGGFTQARRGTRPLRVTTLLDRDASTPDSHRELWVEKKQEESEAPDAFACALAAEEGEEFGGKEEPKVDPVLSRIAKEGAGKLYDEQMKYPSVARLHKKAQLKHALIKKAAELRSQLLPQQRRVVRRMRKQPGLVVAHGTGQGKTLASIGAVVDLNPKSTKIYTPAPLRENYRKEIEKHVEGELPVKIESIQKLTRTGRAPQGDMLVIDEAHRIRNPQSKGYGVVSRAKADKRMLLTASPVYNQPEDIAPLVNLAAGKPRLPTGTQFRQRYIKQPSKGLLSAFNPWAQKEPVVIRKSELGGILRSWVDYEKGKEEGFPSLTERRINVRMSDRQSKLHDMAWGRLPIVTRMRLSRGLPPERKDLSSINQFQSQARQIASSESKFTKGRAEVAPKIRTAVSNFDRRDKRDPDHRAVVYANYLNTLQDYSRELKQKKVPHAVFTGKQSKREKDRMVRDYNDGQLKALLISGAGAEGLDLKGTRQVQVLEPHWNEERVRQVIGRARRYRSHDHLPLGKRNVTVERYASQPKRGFFGRKRKGIDDVLYDMSEQKEQLNRQVVELMRARSGK